MAVTDFAIYTADLFAMRAPHNDADGVLRGLKRHP